MYDTTDERCHRRNQQSSGLYLPQSDGDQQQESKLHCNAATEYQIGHNLKRGQKPISRISRSIKELVTTDGKQRKQGGCDGDPAP